MFYRLYFQNPASGLSEFCPINGDWDKLGRPNLTQMSLIKCYWMLQNAKATAFNISE